MKGLLFPGTVLSVQSGARRCFSQELMSMRHVNEHKDLLSYAVLH